MSTLLTNPIFLFLDLEKQHQKINRKAQLFIGNGNGFHPLFWAGFPTYKLIQVKYAGMRAICWK